MISSADAMQLISKYRDEQTRLRITLILRDKSINIRLTGRLVSEERSGQLTFVAPNGDHCLVLLPNGCLFESGDSREVGDPELRAAVETKFAGALTILLPSKERLYIMELRD